MCYNTIVVKYKCERSFDLNYIITISRQHGSGGKEIGELLSEKLGIPVYDNKLIQLAAEKSGFSEEHFRDYDKNASNSFLYSLVRGFQYHQNATSSWSLEDKIYATQSGVIREIADKGPCIIIGRCADYILSEKPNIIKIFIYGSLDSRAERVANREGISKDEALNKIKSTDKRRQNYYNYHADTKWGDATNYNLCIDSSFCGVEKAAQIICDFIKSI
jgi:cytidylate kinase